ERGFSFRAEGPLDMRMDPNSTLTASQIVNEYDVAELERILREYGEERWARRIAQFVVARRPLRTTRDLAQAVEAAIPRRAWPRAPPPRHHPASRAALRSRGGRQPPRPVRPPPGRGKAPHPRSLPMKGEGALAELPV